MTSKETLKQWCKDCEYTLSLAKQRCPFRSISNDYCDEYNVLFKDLEVLEILKNNLTMDENYYSQDNGSTEAIKLCISNCVSVEEDEEYADECYPNCDYYKVKEWLENERNKD